MRDTAPSWWGIVLLALLLPAWSCQNAEEQAAEEQAAREAALRTARADSVAMAEAQFDPTVFDTVTWESPEARIERGSIVWSFSCAKCHGAAARGDGELARERNLAVPTLLAPDWRHGGNVPAIRQNVYVGHESEMPSWGLYGLAYRDVDAVAVYIDEVLRQAQSGP